MPRQARGRVTVGKAFGIYSEHELLSFPQLKNKRFPKGGPNICSAHGPPSAVPVNTVRSSTKQIGLPNGSRA
jgi:hypothetical protein